MKCDPMYFPHEVWEKHYDELYRQSLQNHKRIQDFLRGGQQEDVWRRLKTVMTSFLQDFSANIINTIGVWT